MFGLNVNRMLENWLLERFIAVNVGRSLKYVNSEGQVINDIDEAPLSEGEESRYAPGFLIFSNGSTIEELLEQNIIGEVPDESERAKLDTKDDLFSYLRAHSKKDGAHYVETVEDGISIGRVGLLNNTHPDLPSLQGRSRHINGLIPRELLYTEGGRTIGRDVIGRTQMAMLYPQAFPNFTFYLCKQSAIGYGRHQSLVIVNQEGYDHILAEYLPVDRPDLLASILRRHNIDPAKNEVTHVVPSHQVGLLHKRYDFDSGSYRHANTRIVHPDEIRHSAFANLRPARRIA